MATPDDPRQYPGQMNIWECIEVAESGLDGKSTGTSGTVADNADPTTSRSDESGSPSSDAGAPAPTQRLSIAEVVRRRMENR